MVEILTLHSGLCGRLAVVSGCRSAVLRSIGAARSGSLDGYFFNSIPIVRAIRLTDPAWRPNSAAIFDTPAPCRASLDNCWTSRSAHCFGFCAFMVQRSTCRPLNRSAWSPALGKFTGGACHHEAQHIEEDIVVIEAGLARLDSAAAS